MSIHLKLLSTTSLVLLLILTTSQHINASSIENNIQISTNTGGNTTDQDNTNIQTGSATTSININNSAQSTTSGQTNIDSQTTIKLQNEAGGEFEAKITGSGQTFHIYNQDGKHYLETSDDQGNTQTRELSSAEELTIQSTNGQVRVQNAGQEYIIIHNQTKARTALPIKSDQQTQALFLINNDTDFELKTLPQELVQHIEQDQLLTEIFPTSHIYIEPYQDQLAYQVLGSQSKKLFGFIPMKFNTRLYLSTENGAIINQTYSSALQGFLAKLSV